MTMTKRERNQIYKKLYQRSFDGLISAGAYIKITKDVEYVKSKKSILPELSLFEPKKKITENDLIDAQKNALAFCIAMTEK